eukprot:CAMPEP_0204604520 /NCGR_PEP_ID=MMETSP0661-20131031/57926_1 /ASSEMBLY_ACC=CAM_ASM_000606 /TAXON_ID=109239 /ORGANISM="Alexandrium margalefi, Strain AMGDE01CS-322" /LENGTH=348 /DNA_ID=CAMNT_0051615689 /DNA_START=49 /DNA_END=1093 /DNA_ORIENTATION=-
MNMFNLSSEVLPHAVAALDGIGMSRLSCAHRCFDEIVHAAVVKASARLGRSVPPTLPAGLPCWPKWHETDDDPFDSFTSADPFGLVCGKVYRLYMCSPDFKDHSCELECGLSLLLWPDRTGTLAVYEVKEGALPRVGSISCRLREDTEVAQAIGGLLLSNVGVATNKDVLQLFDPCGFDWEVQQPDGSYTDDNMHMALSPIKPGLKFRFEHHPDPQFTKDGDVTLHTPNCDWLGRYLIRPADVALSAASVETEAAYWGPFLAQQRPLWKEAREAHRRELLRRVTPAVGSNVTVVRGFRSICEHGVMLEPGDIGTTEEIDDDGDARISFQRHGELWVDSNDFTYLDPSR